MKQAVLEFNEAKSFIHFQNRHGGTMTFRELPTPNATTLQDAVITWKAARRLQKEHVVELELAHELANRQGASEVKAFLIPSHFFKFKINSPSFFF